MYLYTNAIFSSSVDAVIPFSDDYSFEYDGVNDSVSIGTTSLGITSAISVSAWVKIPTSNTGGGGANIQMIVCEDTTSSGQRNWGLSWRGTGSNYFSFQIWHTNSTNTSINSTGITPNDGQWHHLLGTYDGTTSTNGMKFYIDGVLNGQKTATSTGINSFSSSEPTIGAKTNGTARILEGNIDEAAVWNSDQNANISTIYGSGVPTDISSLSPLGHWRAENSTWNGSVWSVTDSGSGGNNGTSSGMTLSSRSTDVPT